MGSISVDERRVVIDLVEHWRITNKLQSIRDQNKKVPKSIIETLVQLAKLASHQPNSKTDRADIAHRLIRSVATTSIVISHSRGKKTELKNFVDLILNDERVKQLNYGQFLYFLSWLRRIV